MKYIIVIFFLTVTSLINAQSFDLKINDCEGGVDVFDNNSYTFDLLEESNVFSNYSFSKQISIQKMAWVNFVAPSDGFLNFTVYGDQTDLNCIVFKKVNEAICDDIHQGFAEVMRYIVQKDSSSIGLRDSLFNAQFLAPIETFAGNRYAILVFSENKKSSAVHFDLNFVNTKEPLSTEDKFIDLRDDDFSPGIEIHVIDSITNQPIVSYISVLGNVPFEGMYTASTLILPSVARFTDLQFTIDAFGYMYKTFNERVRPNVNLNYTIKLESVEKGKTYTLESIQFIEGTSEFMAGSEEKLNRLRSFLMMHADLEIEIIGHVFDTGRNSFSAQLMSEARAKKVVQYLKSQGINEKRMSSKGYGNKRPVFAEPKLASEEQANRRVEIVIK